MNTLFCDACSEEVEYNRITRDGQIELTCQFCGFTLGVGGEEASIRARCILVADDSPSVRVLVKKAILDTRLSKDVVTFENGIDFISVFARRLTEKESMDLVVLDLEMPEMDGVIAARVMRFIENQYKSKRVPILFFTGRKADDSLKQQLREFLPASYVNKSSDGAQTDVPKKIKDAITKILKKSQDQKKSG